jgi:hypothetical protein
MFLEFWAKLGNNCSSVFLILLFGDGELYSCMTFRNGLLLGGFPEETSSLNAGVGLRNKIMLCIHVNKIKYYIYIVI